MARKAASPGFGGGPSFQLAYETDLQYARRMGNRAPAAPTSNAKRLSAAPLRDGSGRSPSLARARAPRPSVPGVWAGAGAATVSRNAALVFFASLFTLGVPAVKVGGKKAKKGKKGKKSGQQNQGPVASVAGAVNTPLVLAAGLGTGAVLLRGSSDDEAPKATAEVKAAEKPALKAEEKAPKAEAAAAEKPKAAEKPAPAVEKKEAPKAAAEKPKPAEKPAPPKVEKKEAPKAAEKPPPPKAEDKPAPKAAAEKPPAKPAAKPAAKEDAIKNMMAAEPSMEDLAGDAKKDDKAAAATK